MDGRWAQELWASTRRIGVALLVAGAIAVVVMTAIQDRLLYFPDAASVEASVAATGAPLARPWPGRDDFRGVLVEPPAVPVRGTVLVFHGNAGHAGHRGEYAERFGALGWRVLLVEYPGYGARPGRVGETTMVTDAAQTIDRARRQFGRPLVVVGESLGAGVAAGAVGTDLQAGSGVDGLVLITPWDTLAGVAAHHYPWLPVRWLLADRYDSVAALRGFSGPTVVVVAGSDEIVPPRFGLALYEGLSGRKRLRRVEGAGHNDWIDCVGEPWWGELISDF